MTDKRTEEGRERRRAQDRERYKRRYSDPEYKKKEQARFRKRYHDHIMVLRKRFRDWYSHLNEGEKREYNRKNQIRKHPAIRALTGAIRELEGGRISIDEFYRLYGECLTRYDDAFKTEEGGT